VLTLNITEIEVTNDTVGSIVLILTGSGYAITAFRRRWCSMVVAVPAPLEMRTWTPPA
jgi:hypothetical protein